MLYWKNIENGVQFLFGTHGKQFVDFANVTLFLGVALFHIKDQCLEQIHFCVVPEMITSLTAGIFDNDIAE